MSDNIDNDLSYLFNNNLKIIDKKTYDLINNDIDILSDYYIKILCNECNFNFCIDICSELDMYMTDEIVDDMNTYLSFDNRGYKLLFNRIKDKHNIIPDEKILISLLDYYFDLLLSNK